MPCADCVRLNEIKSVPGIRDTFYKHSTETCIENFFLSLKKKTTYGKLSKEINPEVTLGIFLLLLPFWGSPKEKMVSSGLLGVEGGLILEGDPVPSRLSFRMSRSLKLRRSEFCRKKMGLESNWGRRQNGRVKMNWYSASSNQALQETIVKAPIPLNTKKKSWSIWLADWQV